MTSSPLRIAIAGGGIAGLATAVALRCVGHEVSVFERRRQTEAGGMMLLWPNGLRALDALARGERVRKTTAAIDTVEFRTASGGQLATWPVDAGAEPVRLVPRAQLVRLLREALPAETVRFGHAVSAVREGTTGVAISFDDGTSTEQFDVVVACDGFRSKIRTQLFGTSASAPGSQHVGWHAIADDHDTKAIPFGTAVASIGRGRRLCVARIDAERVFWYATADARQRGTVVDREALVAMFRDWHPSLRRLLTATGDRAVTQITVADRPLSARWGCGRVTLLGDAIHPCLPDLAQGAGQALESAVSLAHHLAASEPIETALRRHEMQRRAAMREVVETARLVATLSTSDAVHVAILRDAVGARLLKAVGIPKVSRLAQMSVAADRPNVTPFSTAT